MEIINEVNKILNKTVGTKSEVRGIDKPYKVEITNWNNLLITTWFSNNFIAI